MVPLRLPSPSSISLSKSAAMFKPLKTVPFIKPPAASIYPVNAGSSVPTLRLIFKSSGLTPFNILFIK